MKYSKPEVTLLGNAGELIQGTKIGSLEVPDASQQAQRLAEYED